MELLTKLTTKHIASLLVIGLLAAIAIGWNLHGPSQAVADDTDTGDAIEKPAQEGPSSTPAPANLPTGTITPNPPTGTPTRTPTEAGPALIEAKNPQTNVRVGPDITSDRIGTIDPGTRYVVRARRFKWLRIDFPDAPTGIGWVFEDVVNIIGDPALIPEIAEEDLPTPDLTAAAAEETQLAATQTPGGLLTLTAAVLVTPQGIFTATPQIGDEPTLAPGQRLPTFTYPAFSPTPVPVQDIRDTVNTDGDDEGIAPLFPIIGLAALGLMGLFVSLLRRF
jgi:hypothetical protein